MKRKIISTLIAVVFAVSTLAIVPIGAGAVAWDGTTIDTTWYTANPEANVFYISTPAELAGFASVVNAGTDTFEGDTVVLTQDIDMGSKNFTAIGETANVTGTPTGIHFKGTFEGLGHLIKNINIVVSSGYQSVGFFGNLSGHVKNVGFDTALISTRANQYNIAAGTICAVLLSGASIENCYVKNSAVQFSAGAKKSQTCLGGVAGIALTGSSIINSYVDGLRLTQIDDTTSAWSGALAGSFWGTNENGSAGTKYHNNTSRKTVNVENSYFINTTFVNADLYGAVGKVVGSTFTNVYYNGLQDAEKGTVKVLTNDELEAFKTDRTTYPLGDNFINVSGACPDLVWENGGAVASMTTNTADTTWYNAGASVLSLATADELLGLSKLVTDGTTTFEGKEIYLLADIDLDGAVWKAIGGTTRNTGTGVAASVTKCFKGMLNGNGHIIKNMTVDVAQSNASGLFNYLAGTVKNLGIEDTVVNAQSGSYFDGFGTVAYASFNAVIDNCYVKNTQVTRVVEGTRPISVGGMVGIAYHDTKIRNSFVNGLEVKLGTNVTNTSATIGGMIGNSGYDFDSEKGAFVDNAETGIKIEDSYVAGLLNRIDNDFVLANVDMGNGVDIISSRVGDAPARNIKAYADGAFVIDEKNLNNGFPILPWQTERSGYSSAPDFDGVMFTAVDDNSFNVKIPEGEECEFIAAYYAEDGSLVNAEKAEISDGVGNINKPDGCTKVCVFAWSSFAELVPVCGSIEQ